MKKTTVIIIVGMMIVPLLLSITAKYSNLVLDVPLSGFSEDKAKPVFSLECFFNGDYQHSYLPWFEQNLKPRGVLTKTYSSLRYNLFDMGNNDVILGAGKDIFATGYVSGELCINGGIDYSDPRYQEEMQLCVNKLQQLQDKLREFDKFLFVYIAASKGNFNYTNIPKRIRDVAPEGRITSTEYFSKLIADTTIPHIICRDYKDQLEYPAFYPTGIHWSRTFEQIISSKIIEGISQASGKQYRQLLLGEANESTKPIGRDDDGYSLQNVWNPIRGITFYEYAMSREDKADYDKFRLLIQGDSFSEGIIGDIRRTFQFQDIHYINRCAYYQAPNSQITPFESWESLDLSSILDGVDGVIIEATEPELQYYFSGFVDYLLSFLESYVPRPAMHPCVQELDLNRDEVWDALNSGAVAGLYGKDSNYTWTEPSCLINLQNDTFDKNGLELEFEVPEALFAINADPATVEVYINGHRIYRNVFFGQWKGQVSINPNEFKVISAKDAIYEMEFFCNKSFVPNQVGIFEDNRDFAIKLYYIGGKR